MWAFRFGASGEEAAGRLIVRPQSSVLRTVHVWTYFRVSSCMAKGPGERKDAHAYYYHGVRTATI